KSGRTELQYQLVLAGRNYNSAQGVVGGNPGYRGPIHGGVPTRRIRYCNADERVHGSRIPDLIRVLAITGDRQLRGLLLSGALGQPFDHRTLGAVEGGQLPASVWCYSRR